jgi:hypothetical protein
MRASDIVNPTHERLVYSQEGYLSFQSFYAFYLGEHKHPVCRRLHLLGTSLVVTLLCYVIVTRRWAVIVVFCPLTSPSTNHRVATAFLCPPPTGRRWQYLGAAPLVGYGLAWLGHYAFERNSPATFKHPLYSLLGDFRMWWECVSGARSW